MANRYRNRGYGRDYENRGGYGNRSSDYDRYSSNFGQGRYGGGEYSDYDREYDREDDYYGGSRRSASSLRGGESESGRAGSYSRDEDDYTTGYYRGGRGYGRGRSGGYRGGEYDRDSYYGGGSSLNEYGGGGTYGGYREREYGRGYRRYSGNYPESESGYDLESGDERGFLDRASDEISSWFGDEEAERRREMDARRQGSHRGRGPRNYRRSDERIQEEINDELTDNDYLDASDIEVHVSNGEVTLTGTVDSRYDKRLAEDLAEDVSGVANVENRLRVRQNYSSQGISSLNNQTAGTTGTTGTTGTGGSLGTASGTSSTTGLTGNASTTGSSETTGTTATGRSRGKTA